MNERFPSFFYDTYHDSLHPGGSYDSIDTKVVADTANGRVFEYNIGDPCPGASAPYVPANFIELDIATSRPVAGTCVNAEYRASTYTKALAVDSKDHLVFVTENSYAQAATNVGLSIDVYDEDTLKRVKSWTLPPVVAGEAQNIYAMSWSPLNDELVVMVSGGGDPTGSGNLPFVGIVAYEITSDLSGKALWDVMPVSPCQTPMVTTRWGAVEPYHSQRFPTVYVPCTLAGGYPASLGGLSARVGVAQVHLVRKDQGGQCSDSSAAASALCPADPVHEFSATVAPALANDFLFDPGSDRGFMPCCAGTGNLDLYVYDGAREEFIGRTNLGTNASSGSTTIDLDPETGRLYAFTPENGLTVLDGRRNPLPVGDSFKSLGVPVEVGRNNIMPVLQPDRDHPYPRALAPLGGSAGCGGTVSQGCHLVSLLEYADRYPLSQDPPPSAEDANTYNGSLPAGVTLDSNYDGAAGGFGVHTDLVGGPQGVVSNWTDPTYDAAGVPFGRGQRDLLGGVSRVRLSGSSAQSDDPAALGNASTMEPADRLTGAYFAYCTNAGSTYGNCASLPCGDFQNLPIVPPTDQAGAQQTCTDPRGAIPSPMPSTVSTSQQWPFPGAACSQPGSGRSSDTAGGMQVTTGYAPDGTPNIQPVPGTSLIGAAHVDCRSVDPVKNSVAGTAGLNSDGTALGTASPLLSAGIAHVLSFTVGWVSTQTTVVPPNGPAGIMSKTTASVHRLHIDLPPGPGGANSIDIGRITQDASATAHGRVGTAATTDRVDVSDVTIMVDGSGPTRLCDAVDQDAAQGGQSVQHCGLKQVIDELNASFPSYLHVMSPASDNAPPGDAHLGNAQSNGTPGGYEAIVQADVNQQYGDQKFNGMSTDESAFLSALRIVVYDDGVQGLTREVLDLAGVRDEAHYGYQAPQSTQCDGCTPPPIDVVTAAVDAGVPPTSTYVPGSDIVPVPSHPMGASAGDLSPLALIQRTFAGLAWLVRSPAAALQMLSFLVLLGAPLAVMLRRKRWSDEMTLGGPR